MTTETEMQVRSQVSPVQAMTEERAFMDRRNSTHGSSDCPLRPLPFRPQHRRAQFVPCERASIGRRSTPGQTASRRVHVIEAGFSRRFVAVPLFA
ncbi:hypothetical protein CDV31_013270 [Fusarium ambrosium]|uniref:Uncharacterized protein n=1 Tax=Fusarium ambrosium TaxID=131363 RepID=A0A428T4F6_9HYPO|nr:hypothetical protein CDV31_013270 [Fusarium ambrosium]